MKKIIFLLLPLFLLLLTACTPTDKKLTTEQRIQQILNENPDFFTQVMEQTPAVTQQPGNLPAAGDPSGKTGGSNTSTETINYQCIQNQKILSSCTGCQISTVVRVNSDCSTFTQKETDLTCNTGCSQQSPTKAPANAFTPTITATACCKVCTKGKACGDKCISSNAICNKPSGCACNP